MSSGCWWDGVNRLDGSLSKKAMAERDRARDKGKGKKRAVEEVVVAAPRPKSKWFCDRSIY
jgi:hypothetical protein